MRVLVVEDSAAVRTRVVDLLREAGHEVVGEAATTDVALQLQRTLRPEAIVLDLQLLDGNGMEILPVLKSHHPPPVVVVLTNSAQAECRRRCLFLGADYFFDKSHDFESVADALTRHAA